MKKLIKQDYTEPFRLPPPRKLNKKVSDTIGDIVREGLYPTRACEAISIHKATYFEWMHMAQQLIDQGYMIEDGEVLDSDGVIVPDGNWRDSAYEYLYLNDSIKRAEADFLRDALGKVREYAGATKQWAGEMTLVSRRFREYADVAPSTSDTVSHALDRLRELVAEIKRPELPSITVESKQLKEGDDV